VPHKEAAMNIVDTVTPLARRIGAVNTIVVENGKLTADNTDAYGFMASLKAGAKNFDITSGPSVVLGAGGAARAICAALLDGGAPQLILLNRTADRAEAIARDLGGPISAEPWSTRADVLGDAALLVNTTTLGMVHQPPLEIVLDKLSPKAVVTDAVYAPLETALLKAAKERGNTTVDGLGMLLYQAQSGFARWFGVTPEVTPELRAHVLAG